ncbi:MAG: T9SS type A sorting domain-containing protein [Bacteroidota bacterium]|nr:T9SS type A sorting domain-containing protein [Bacteroidota bacterium]
MKKNKQTMDFLKNNTLSKMIFRLKTLRKMVLIGSLTITKGVIAQPAFYDLISCQSTDGINWTNNALFQDSSGVPSVTQHSTGAIYCAFQWFPAPATPTNTSFDKIAIKKSTDGGLTWGSPTLAVFTGSPSGYKRPFDPTIVITDNGNIRMYFSSSKTGTLGTLDSTVHCYSAISSDGVNYTWESGVRVLVADSINIDPAVIKMGSVWHYTCPRGAPQDGATHFISNDGLAFTRTTTILSDANHNWTGNLMNNVLFSGTGYRFYGTPNPQTNSIWYKSTNDGFIWSSYVNCVGPITTSGIQADPAVIKLSATDYRMIYVSKQSSITGINKNESENSTFSFYPNPASNLITLKSNIKTPISKVSIFDLSGKLVYQSIGNTQLINHNLEKGIYILEVEIGNTNQSKKLIIN